MERFDKGRYNGPALRFVELDNLLADRGDIFGQGLAKGQ